MGSRSTQDGQTLAEGDSVAVKGSSSTYTLSHKGNVYMCTCPAWKNQGTPIDRRTCKHLRGYLGDDLETKRVGAAASSRAASTTAKAARTSGRSSGGANKKATVPPILLAHKWEVDHDPTGWWMSNAKAGAEKRATPPYTAGDKPVRPK